jgi:N-acetylmuramoyl-L-alanine amidase
MRAPASCVLLALFLAAPGPGGAAPAPDPAAPAPPLLPESLRTFEVSPEIRVRLDENGALFLEVRREKDESLEAVARRTMADPTRWEVLRAHNPAAEPSKLPQHIRIPYEELQEALRYLTIARLFPEDGLEGEAWVHRVGRARIPVASENLWHLAAWFTGDGRNFERIAEINRLRNLAPEPGQELRIPREMLLPIFTAPAATEEGDLTFGRDGQGEFAAYRLRKGEAIYSSVVVRFTGLVEADEVNQMATVVAKRSGIEDVHTLAVGFQVKIPREHVLPEFLPRDDLRRIEFELSRREVARFRNQAVSRHLEGVTVILDAGHGGRDIGAAHNGVWESDYVYDITSRIKAKLETETAAQVLTTIKDSQHGYRIFDARKLPLNQAEVVLTSPPFHLSSDAPNGIGVNLRWYLANSYHRSLTRKGVDPDKIVFASIHADSLHPSLRGTMVYVPGEQYRQRTYGFGSAVYAKRREVQEQTYVSFTKEERLRAEGLSREFASHLITSLRRRGARIHPYQPVRDRIIRKRRPWVPAVLRCNRVSVQVLLEAVNISNPEDARLLTDPAYRQLVADAFVDALLKYYA